MPNYEVLGNEKERVIIARKLHEQFIQHTGFVPLEERTSLLGNQLVDYRRNIHSQSPLNYTRR
jgi:hypothetical protein